MSYPSIFTVWDGTDRSRAAVEAASAMASAWSAHLDVAALGVDRCDTGFYGAEFALDLANASFARAKFHADEAARDARSALDRPGLTWAVRPVALKLGELEGALARIAWFQDLIVLPQPFGGAEEDISEAVLDAALFGAPAPVLVVPGAAAEPPGANVLVAWNGSMEAMRALRAALPILKRAGKVEAVLIDQPARRGGYADPGASLGAMLSRHKVNAEVAVLPQSGDTVADTLSRRALETGADLIVMGAYGHSRFRERMLGGATRDMLRQAKTPVLFAR